jgi:methionyl-tRNA synthetase
MNKFYVTTSIPYVNAAPHIGHALEFIQADVLARFYRQKKDDVFFLTGTDDHGLKVAKAAEKAGKKPKEFTDEISQKFKNLKKILNLSNDDFIRTADEIRHWPTVKKIWEELENNGDIYKKKYKGLYCVGCEAFIPKKDLISGKCSVHQKELEEVEEENYFLKLSKYLPRIVEIIETDKIRIIPASRKNEILSMIKQGIEDISFSRVKERYWGFPVPGDDKQTIYVWCDALSNYISALDYANNGSKFKKYWPADVHCIGKDIIKFHAIYWPAMLLSLGLELPKNIFVHGFITVDGEKISKTIGNVIDPFEIVKKYGTDALRYYLLREIPPTNDGDFTFEKLEERYNSDLAKGLGNLVARVLTLAQKFTTSHVVNEAVLFEKAIQKAEKNVEKAITDFKFNDALAEIWRLIAAGDKYIDDKKPWALAPESKEFRENIGSLLFLISKISKLLLPFLPETSEKIANAIKNKKSITLFPRLN